MNVVELERNGTPTPTLTPSTTADGIKKKRAPPISAISQSGTDTLRTYQRNLKPPIDRRNPPVQYSTVQLQYSYSWLILKPTTCIRRTFSQAAVKWCYHARTTPI